MHPNDSATLDAQRFLMHFLMWWCCCHPQNFTCVWTDSQHLWSAPGLSGSVTTGHLLGPLADAWHEPGSIMRLWYRGFPKYGREYREASRLRMLALESAVKGSSQFLFTIQIHFKASTCSNEVTQRPNYYSKTKLLSTAIYRARLVRVSCSGWLKGFHTRTKRREAECYSRFDWCRASKAALVVLSAFTHGPRVERPTASKMPTW